MKTNSNHNSPKRKSKNKRVARGEEADHHNYSYEKSGKNKIYEDNIIGIDFMKQYKEGYESEPDIVSKKNTKKGELNNIIQVKFVETNEDKKSNYNELNGSINDNIIHSKKKKKKKKKSSRLIYEKKIIELEEKEDMLSKQIKEYELKNQKQKELKKDIEIERDKFEEKKKSFDKERANKFEQLKLKEKELNKMQLLLEKEEKIYYNKKIPILIGLNNIGATCYMNASLQCLSNTKELTEFFLNNYKDKNKKKHIITYEYYELIKNLWNEKNNNKPYSPYSFKDVLSQENELFAGIQANDSKDLINFLIERLHQELNVIKENNNNENFYQVNQLNENEALQFFLKDFTSNFNSIISKLFYGILETKSQCKGCNIIKFNFQLYSFLEFPLQHINQYFYNNGKRPLFTQDGKNPDVDLYECFEYNRKIDLMNGENQMYCNICNKLCDATYTNFIYSGPNYLIINLNRGRGAVYECKVNFPEQLNLFNYVSYKHGITAYELYAVICHLGPSSMSGHFVAYCRNRIDNKWYLYNDAFVSLCDKPKQYNEGMPYILFYRVLKCED